MEIGIAQLLPSFGYEPSVTDNTVYRDEIALAMQADKLDYDHLWVVEHHFEDYSFCPDNFVFLAHLAACTNRIKLATGAVIVPWHTQPLRIAERAAMLDQLSDGRFILGVNSSSSRSRWTNRASATTKRRR